MIEHMPIAMRPRNNPLYDRTWLGNARRDGVLRFFYHGIGRHDGDTSHVKTRADTNMVCDRMLPKGWVMHAYGLYLCPDPYGLGTSGEFDQRFNAEQLRDLVGCVRWRAVCYLRFGDTLHTEIPACCVLANVVGKEPEVEAVPLTENVRAIDVSARQKKWREEWTLEPRPDYDLSDLIGEPNHFPLTIRLPEKKNCVYPIEITGLDDWHVRLEQVPCPGDVLPWLRSFLNGVLLKGITV